MNRNFKIEDQIALVSNDNSYYFDLHSNFKFKNFMYDISKAEVTLIWEKSKERWAAKEEFETIELRFHDISFFRIYQDSLAKQVHLDSNISYIGYLYPECLDIANGCLPPNDEDPSYHMVFGFESGMNIRIFSSEVVLQYFQLKIRS